jgi:poly(beta-D-mannuronate) lyase
MVSRGKSVLVSNIDELENAAASAPPGETILVAPGDYSHMITIGASGAASAPILIRAVPGRSAATIVAPVVLAGSHVILSGFNFDDGGRVQITGDDNRVTGSTFRGPASYGVEVVGSRNRIDHNDLQVIGTMEGPGWGVRIALPTTNPGAGSATGNRIDHNYFHDMTGFHHNGHEAIQVQDPSPDTAWRTLIDHNLFSNISIDTEIISLKSSGNVVEHNTFLSSHAPRHVVGVSNRYGSDNQFLYNVISDVQDGLIVWGKGIVVVGNRFENSPLDLMAGNTSEKDRVRGGQPFAEDVLVAGNFIVGSFLRIGYQINPELQTLPARGTMLGANDAKVVTVVAADTINVQVDKQFSFARAKRLNQEDVGPNARDTDCPTN